MSTMETFYASLSSVSNLQDPYLEALATLTKIEPHQMSVLASEQGWQDWWAPTLKPATD